MKILNNVEKNVVVGGATYWCQVTTKEDHNKILATFEMVKDVEEKTKEGIYNEFKKLLGNVADKDMGSYHISCHKYDR